MRPLGWQARGMTGFSAFPCKVANALWPNRLTRQTLLHERRYVQNIALVGAPEEYWQAVSCGEIE
ncbi:hypothetical protein C8J41_10669 [Sphingomonas sp. PP-CC-3G-468]|nr:hypothetical protein C8J41_10669 [Sphingomonas sp. PP-CC-3G-468]